MGDLEGDRADGVSLRAEADDEAARFLAILFFEEDLRHVVAVELRGEAGGLEECRVGPERGQQLVRPKANRTGVRSRCDVVAKVEVADIRPPPACPVGQARRPHLHSALAPAPFPLPIQPRWVC